MWQEHDVLNKQILKFLSPPTIETVPKDECVHVLDLYKKNLIREGPSHPCICNSGCFGKFFERKEPKRGAADEVIQSATELHEAGIWFKKSKTQSLRDITFGRFFAKKEPKEEIIRSATELHEAGIWFKKSKTKSLRDITFSYACGILKLPIMVVDDTTESILLNIIAFERLHVGASNEVMIQLRTMSCVKSHRGRR